MITKNVAICSLVFAASLAATPVSAQETPAVDAAEVTQWSSNRHLVGFTYEVGAAHSLGLRYLLTWESGQTSVANDGGMSWTSLSLRPRMIIEDDNLEAGAVDLMGSAAFFGHTGGGSFELGIGPTFGDRTVIATSLGVMWSMLFLELGYVYQFPFPGFNRPSWLASHQFAVRINVPFLETGRTESTETLGGD